MGESYIFTHSDIHCYFEKVILWDSAVAWTLHTWLFNFFLSFGLHNRYRGVIDMGHVLNLVYTRVSKGTGQCNFSGKRDRNFFIVPGQRDIGTEVPSLSRDKGTSSKSCHGTGRAGIFWDCPVPGRPAGQNQHLFGTFMPFSD